MAKHIKLKRKMFYFSLENYLLIDLSIYRKMFDSLWNAQFDNFQAFLSEVFHAIGRFHFYVKHEIHQSSRI